MTDINMWKEVLEAVDIPLFVIDTRRIVVFANAAVKSMVNTLGFVGDVTGAEGRSLFDLVPMLSESVGSEYETLFATGKPQQDEHAYRVGNTTVFVQSQRFPILSGREVSHVITIIRDVTEFRAGQEALKQSEATARAIINATTESILLTDRNGTIITANEVAARRLGKSIADLIGKTGKELFPPEVWRRREPYLRSVASTGKQAGYRDTRDGIVFDYTMYPVLDEAGRVRQIAIFAADVTQHVAAHEESIRIRQAVESSSDAIAMSDMSGRHVFSNKAFEDLLGYTVEQLNDAGGPPAAYRDPMAAVEVFETLKSGKPWSGVVDMVTRGGRELLVDIRADAIRDAEGKLIGLIGIHTDVTTQRQADEQLRRSEERFRLQFSSIPVPTLIWGREDNDFVLRDFNLAAEKMTRGGIVKFVGSRASEMYKDRPGILSDLRECFDSQATVFREMSNQYHSVPEERYLSVHYVPIPPDLILVHMIDLTDRKRAESELQMAHNELEKKVHERTEALRKQVEFDLLVRRLLTSFASCGETEIDGQICKGLSELAEFTGTESAFTVLVSWDQTFYRVAHSWVKAEWPDYTSLYQHEPFGSNVWLEGKILEAEDVQIRTLDDFPEEAVKERRMYEREGVKSTLMVPLRGRGGSIKGAIGLRSYARVIEWEEQHFRWLRTVGDAVANVLERKQAEAARRVEQDKAELYLQAAEVILVALDADGTITRINRKGCQILGYEEHELLGKNWFETCIRPEEHDLVMRAAKGLYSNNAAKYETFENSVVTKSGVQRLIAWHNSVLYDKNGKVIGSLSSGEDVTDRKRAEIELDTAYERLQVEQEALQQKNVALQEMVEQIQESKRSTAAQIQTNLERIVLPVIERIGPRLDPQGQQYLDLVRTSLSDILSPFVSDLESRFKRLSPREIEICELIRRGYDSKRIADLRSSSVQTVLKQRTAIRKKLGLDKKKVNLSTYLTSTFPTQRKREKGKKIV